MCSYSKRQPHIHAGGITLYWCIDEFLDLGKGNDFIEFLFDLCLVHPEYGAIKKNILTTGQFRMKACSDLKEACNTAFDLYLTFCRRCNPGKDFEES
jgi:hypothetical protein